MKLRLILAFLLIAYTSRSMAQTSAEWVAPISSRAFITNFPSLPKPHKEIHLSTTRWKITGNRIKTGAMVFLAGVSKGFNETLQFHWKEFHRQFPGANPQWFNPTLSWRNKYRNGDPDQGPKSFLSTSVLIMFTDQYHLNNFINKMAWGSAIVFKLGEGRKPFKQYLLDFLYYGLCHQAGFALSYYPFSRYKGK